MNESQNSHSSVDLAQGRVAELIETQAQQGRTQQQLAASAGLPSQYLSDVKRGRRPLTELAARRLSEPLNLNYEWLLGVSDSMTTPRIQPSSMDSGGPVIRLPIFSSPIDGEPRAHKKWDGAVLELIGAAAAKAESALKPYILRFGHNDMHGRLRKGDFVLISQSKSDAAEIFVVQHKKKMFLARLTDNGWERVANGTPLSADCPIIGIAHGIVWAPLVS